jgi:DNA repair exonuclease SbcCD ATPase subunit
MYLKSLHLENIGIHKQLQYYPAAAGCNFITGRNGAGKSTIFNTLQFLLVQNIGSDIPLLASSPKSVSRKDLINKNSIEGNANAVSYWICDNKELKISVCLKKKQASPVIDTKWELIIDEVKINKTEQMKQFLKSFLSSWYNCIPYMFMNQGFLSFFPSLLSRKTFFEIISTFMPVYEEELIVQAIDEARKPANLLKALNETDTNLVCAEGQSFLNQEIKRLTFLSNEHRQLLASLNSNLSLVNNNLNACSYLKQLECDEFAEVFKLYKSNKIKLSLLSCKISELEEKLKGDISLDDTKSDFMSFCNGLYSILSLTADKLGKIKESFSFVYLKLLNSCNSFKEENQLREELLFDCNIKDADLLLDIENKYSQLKDELERIKSLVVTGYCNVCLQPLTKIHSLIERKAKLEEEFVQLSKVLDFSKKSSDFCYKLSKWKKLYSNLKGLIRNGIDSSVFEQAKDVVVKIANYINNMLQCVVSLKDKIHKIIQLSLVNENNNKIYKFYRIFSRKDEFAFRSLKELIDKYEEKKALELQLNSIISQKSILEEKIKSNNKLLQEVSTKMETNRRVQELLNNTILPVKKAISVLLLPRLAKTIIDRLTVLVNYIFARISFPYELIPSDNLMLEEEDIFVVAGKDTARLGSCIPVSMLSYGEKAIFSFVFFIALQQVLFSTLLDFPLFIDEPSANLDSINKDRLTRLLQWLVENYQSQIFIITHDDTLISGLIDASEYDKRILKLP